MSRAGTKERRGGSTTEMPPGPPDDEAAGPGTRAEAGAGTPGPKKNGIAWLRAGRAGAGTAWVNKDSADVPGPRESRVDAQSQGTRETAPPAGGKADAEPPFRKAGEEARRPGKGGAEAPAWARAGGGSRPFEPEHVHPWPADFDEPHSYLGATPDERSRAGGGEPPDGMGWQMPPPEPPARSRLGHGLSLVAMALLAGFFGLMLGRWSGEPMLPQAAPADDGAPWQLLRADLGQMNEQGRQTLGQVDALHARLGDALYRLDRLEQQQTALAATLSALQAASTQARDEAAPTEPTAPPAPARPAGPALAAAPGETVAPVMVSYGSNVADGAALAAKVAQTLRDAAFGVAEPQAAGPVTGSVVRYAFATDRDRAVAIQSALTPLLPAPPEVEQVPIGRDLPRPGAVMVVLGALQPRADAAGR